MSDDLRNSFYWQERAWAAESKRDALALELQSVKDALARVVAENTAKADALEVAERAQMERDCAAVCERCRSGLVSMLAFTETGTAWVHTGFGLCRAAPIRTAFAAAHPDPANG